jgi:SAM-dependent methyltransferase
VPIAAGYRAVVLLPTPGGRSTRVAPSSIGGLVVTREFDRIAGHWRELGAEDPLWAVYVAPGTQHGGWDVEKFFRTGREEVDGVLAALPQPVPPDGVALDFGCGVGRLSQALARHVGQVIAVDVSPPMIQRARELYSGDHRIDFVLNERPDLAFVADASVDLVYSSLVLQHLSRPLAAGYLAEFVRILAPDGIAIIQVATRPTLSVKGLAFRVLPAALTGLLQRRVLRYPAPMRMQAMATGWIVRAVESAGGRVVDTAVDDSYGGHWVYTRFFIRPRTRG